MSDVILERILAPFGVHFGGHKAPEIVKNRFWKASESSLHFRQVLEAILGANLEKDRLSAGWAGGRGGARLSNFA